MIKFFTSISFLYIFAILILFVYGWFYYRDFAKRRTFSNKFPIVFTAIGLACFSFLYFNMHPPLSLKTFSNLDHYFIRHDGFLVNKNIELGRTDTVNFKNNSYSSFLLEKNNYELKVHSRYSEEPLYASNGGQYKILSYTFPLADRPVELIVDGSVITLQAAADSSFRLKINEDVNCILSKKITRGLSSWNVFKDQAEFINSSYYTNGPVVAALKTIYFLRDDISPGNYGELRCFIAGNIFRFVQSIKYDQKIVDPRQLAFQASLADNSLLAWGLGFLENNRNQYRISFLGKDSFSLLARYPVSYPLTEENKNNWTEHRVNKFIVSDPRDMQQMPAVFSEGFLFAPFSGDNGLDFSPVLLSYTKGKGNASPGIQARFMNNVERPIRISSEKILLPAKAASFDWIFTIHDSFNWNLGFTSLSQSKWEVLIFGSLGFFFLLVLLTAYGRSAGMQSWIWQLLSSITLVLLATRFFLYWRYKSFPPFEGLDLPSLQQLNSPWNFAVIIFASLMLGIIFGFGFLRAGWQFCLKHTSWLLKRKHVQFSTEPMISEEMIGQRISNSRVVKKTGLKIFYFISWFLFLASAGLYAALKGFDPTTCRHLAIGLVLLYFIFLFISYKHSPLVAATEKTWWSIRTSMSTQVIFNNPVKVLLSLSMLALFAFIDIGFAIIFLNFLLFNEAFLCINYAIAGLSAGSKKNVVLFSSLGVIYLLLFVANLLYGPYIFNILLGLSKLFYLLGYLLAALLVAYMITRLMQGVRPAVRFIAGAMTTISIFLIAFLFFPRQKILDKAAITKYRIDVMTMPVDKAIGIAYEDGKTYEPVIRAAQNQWFINTFIFEDNNPFVQQAGFHMLPHAPQTKGAKYNAQATDLVASRFLIAEHGKWSALFYVWLLLVPSVLLSSFYKLYPDFTNRVNPNYPGITTAFSLLNYLLITALLVILAATGRYIFFGQDLPFGSILSKQSILFPALVLILVISLFRRIPLEQYPNRKKLVPGFIVFAILAILLFFVKPVFNKEKDFGAADIAKQMDLFIESRLQPVYDFIDTSATSRRLSLANKDRLFTDTLKQMLDAGLLDEGGKFFTRELAGYVHADFSRHLDQRKLIYLDLYSGKPRLAVNDNYFHVDPPPHLRELWTGNVFSDTTNWNISLWNSADASVNTLHTSNYTNEPVQKLSNEVSLVFKNRSGDNYYTELYLINTSSGTLLTEMNGKTISLAPNAALQLSNPSRIRIRKGNNEQVIVTEPDAFMKNYYVNGNRFYVYPLGEDFIWARNFAESVSSDYTTKGLSSRNAFISLNAGMTDSITTRIREMLTADTAYKNGAEYGIAIADGNGRLWTISDHIKGLGRPDPNDKAAFNRMIRGENGYISQSLLRKEIGNINLLRMNPGPGSTLKPIVFSAIASQLDLDWDKFAAEGFSQKQQFFGGEKVAEYDFEKNNGRISSVVDYIRYSDNYYHSNLILLGSYSRQSLQDLLSRHFASQKPEENFHWPYFSYKGKQYWLDGFQNWPGYMDGKANFGSDSSFLSAGLFNNYGIYTDRITKGADRFPSAYDSLLFREAWRKSGFILPEYALFDQKGTGMDNRRPNEVFMSSFRGHVKGSSQVMIPPVKMVDAFGRLVSQNRNYGLTLNPYAKESPFNAFDVENGVQYSNYLSVIKEKLFEGMRQALFNGTAARLGNMLKQEKEYFYYAKTGTTGDDELKAKSKLFVIVISQKNITDPGFNFRKNKFITIYFTSQNGAAKQNEEFQAAIIKYVQGSVQFKRYMEGH